MKITSTREVYRCRIFHVTEDRAVDPKTGFEIKRSVVRHGGSAVMMAVDDRKRILLVRQYRLPAAKYLWELPSLS
jgi:ADP-ribose pyrophosphatase